MLSLSLVEDGNTKRWAHKVLADKIRSAWTAREQRTIVWRPGRRVCGISHNQELWFTSIRPHNDQTTPRYWNVFGQYRANGNLQIVVEINITPRSNTRRVAGFLARDRASGICYLMHDGSIGGGHPGINRRNFLRWSRIRPVPVEDSEGYTRDGIIVTPLSGTNISSNVERFVQTVANFKQGVRRGEIDVGATDSIQQELGGYSREFSGKKSGRRKKREFEYITRHGDIVHKLAQSRETKGVGHRTNNTFLDLGIINAHGKLLEVHEVKTNSERQTLYTAIGQIMVHSGDDTKDIRKYLVLPKDSRIPQDVKSTIKRLRISILHFEIENDQIHIYNK